MKQGVIIAAAAWAIGGSVPAAAQASTTVLGGGLAQDCSMAAKAYVRAVEAPGARARQIATPADQIEICTRALAEELLGPRDRAATLVNRGVLRMNRESFHDAQADFEAAVRLKPDLAEAHANRGGALIALGQFQAGVDEIDRGLALQTEQPEKSYFNRAVGRERLDDTKGAYRDYLKAAELKPEWEAPRLELARFTVTPRPR